MSVRVLSTMVLPEFDALAESIAARMRCDTALVNVMDHATLISMGHSKAAFQPVERVHQMAHTICGLVIKEERTIIVNDMRVHPHFAALPGVLTMSAAAYIGMPLWHEDEVVGTICAIQLTPRVWSKGEINYVRLMADLAQCKIERQILQQEQEALSHALAENDAALAALSAASGKAYTVQNAEGDLVFASSALETELGLGAQAVMSLPALAKAVALAGRGRAELSVDVQDRPEAVLHARVTTTADGLVLADWTLAERRGVISRANIPKLN